MSSDVKDASLNMDGFSSTIGTDEVNGITTFFKLGKKSVPQLIFCGTKTSNLSS